MTEAGGLGIFGAIVWPTYIGLAHDDPGEGPVPLHEPYEEFDYARGQIIWVTQPDGDILGTARICAPKGVYSYLIFCHGPNRELMIGKDKFDHPIIFDRAGFIDIVPIRNADYLPRREIL